MSYKNLTNHYIENPKDFINVIVLLSLPYMRYLRAMKKIVPFFILLLVTFLGFSQQRGVKPLSLVLDNKEVKLYEESHALIFGMSDYTNGWPSLRGVKTDVSEVKKALETAGFHVVVKENLDKVEMDQAFTDFISEYGKKEQNRLVFYFAGHGHTVKTKFGELLGYIVPTDAPNPNEDLTGFQSKSMPMSRIEEYAKLTDSKHALFMFDACFSGSIFALSRAVPEAINYKTSKPVRQFITSGSEDETVPDKSIFREQFVLALTTDYADANHDGYITGTELGTFLQDNVINYSRDSQHPQYGKIRNPYLDKGDFVFEVQGKSESTTTTSNPNTESELVTEKVMEYGDLQINTEIAGKLYWDNQLKGNVPANSQNSLKNLAPGQHQLKLEGNGFVYKKNVTIKANKTSEIKIIQSDIATENKVETENNSTRSINDSRDGQSYEMVKIGNSYWMTKNMAFKPASGKYWIYESNDNNRKTFGYLYDWETAQKVCPQGWHLPTDKEWQELEQFLGMSNADLSETGWRGIIGKKMVARTKRETNQLYNSTSGLNFTLAGNRVYYNGSFADLHESGYYWTATSNSSEEAFGRNFYYLEKGIYRFNYNKNYGFSVRCVKDK